MDDCLFINRNSKNSSLFQLLRRNKRAAATFLACSQEQTMKLLKNGCCGFSTSIKFKQFLKQLL